MTVSEISRGSKGVFADACFPLLIGIGALIGGVTALVFKWKNNELKRSIAPVFATSIRSYLERDFNDDGKMDAAVLVKERSIGKLGIAIVYGATGKVTILGLALDRER